MNTQKTGYLAVKSSSSEFFNLEQESDDEDGIAFMAAQEPLFKMAVRPP